MHIDLIISGEKYIYMLFFEKIFANFKKMLYLCIRFREMT